MTHTRAPHTRLCRHALLVLAATVGLCGPAAAVNRCTDAQGKVTFSDQPCPSDTQGGAIVVKPATGNAGPSTRSVRTYTPSNPPPATVSGKRARIAALDEAIANLLKKMEADNQESARTIDKLYRELADKDRVANMTPEAARASQAVTFNHIRSIQNAAGERSREYQSQLMQLKSEKDELQRMP